MSTATFIAAAGVDPYAQADEIITAQPAEVSAIGQAFLLAADALAETGSLASLAGELADASAHLYGLTPTELMREVSTVQASLNAGPAQLSAIGQPLLELSAEISTAQLEVSGILDAMEQQCVELVLYYESIAQSGVADSGIDLEAEYVAKGAAIVLNAYQQIVAITDAHDAFMDAILLSLQDEGYLIPPDIEAGVPDVPQGSLPPFPTISGTDPTEAAQWWAALSPQEQALLAQDYPTWLASTPGLPAEVYDLVNRRALSDSSVDVELEIDQTIADLVASGTLTDDIREAMQIQDPRDILSMSPQDLLVLCGLLGPAGNNYVRKLSELVGSRDKITGTQESIADQQVGQQRYLLEYDFDAYDGDGAAVIGIGEVDTADNVAVVVQGATHSAYSIEGQTEDAEAVLDEMDEVGGTDTNAVIVYAAYDNPTVLQSPAPDRAADGGELLADDLAGWDAAHEQASGEGAHTTVIAHSYGTVVISEALRDGATEYVDDVVVLGSPGMGVDGVTDLGMTGDHVFAAMDDDDILLTVEMIDDVLLPSPPFVDPDGEPIHGPPTTTEDFGATVIATGGVDGHGDYFGYEAGRPVDTLLSAAAVATGEYGTVKTT